MLLPNILCELQSPDVNAFFTTGGKSPFDVLGRISSKGVGFWDGSNVGSGMSPEFLTIVFCVFQIINALTLATIMISGITWLVAYGISRKTQSSANYKTLFLKNVGLLFGVSAMVWILNILITICMLTFGLKQG